MCDPYPGDIGARNWQRQEPVFAPYIIIGNILPDEVGVLELGPRAAVARLTENLRYDRFPTFSERLGR